jgi:hypothetical protein
VSARFVFIRGAAYQSDGALEDVPRTIHHWTANPERLLGVVRTPEEEIDRTPGAPRRAHHPVPGVARIDEETRLARAPDQRAVIGGVFVLTRGE